MNQQTQTAQLIASLARQESLLQQLITSLNKPKLGLHNDATDWRATARKAIDNVKALTQVEF